jgi:NAD+ kinase
MSELAAPRRMALLDSGSVLALGAVEELRRRYAWVEPADADVIVALGGDGFMLQTLHAMLDSGRVLPVFGMNRGTIGFLMNEYRLDALDERLDRARAITVNPLNAAITAQSGEVHQLPAINEISLLRETRQAAKIEVLVDGRTMLTELISDGVLVSTPAGSTAYNLSAHGPILPLDSALLALTPLSPFRPRRWRGAILPERKRSCGSERGSQHCRGRYRHRPQPRPHPLVRP